MLIYIPRKMALSPVVTADEYKDKIQLAIEEVNTQSGKTVRSLYDLADELDKAQRKMNIAKTSFASGGIVAAALTIAGIACAPVTFGASLGLTIAGVTIGVTSGVGGFCTELADKIVNSKTLKQAQKEAREFNKKGKDMLCLMDNMEAKHTKTFKVFLADTVKRLLKPNIFESIRNRVRGKLSKGIDGTEPIKVGARVGAVLGTAKVATELVETGLKGLKAAGVVMNLLTVPLDIHTIVTNSITIHKKTPSQTAEEIRKIADDLKGKEVSEPTDEVLKLRRRIEEMTREQEKHSQTWEESKEKISEDITVEMEIIAMEYEYVRKVFLRSKWFTLLVESVLAVVVAVLTVCLCLEGGGWLSNIAHGALVLYDVFLFVFELFPLIYRYYCVYRARSVLRQQTYAMEHMIKVYPRKPTKKSNPRAETTQQAIHGHGTISFDYNISNQNHFELIFVTLKCFLTIYTLFSTFGHTPDYTSDQINVESPTETSFITVIVSVLFLGSNLIMSSMSMPTPDLYMLSLSMVVFMLLKSFQDLQKNIPSDFVEELKNVADDFKCKLNELMKCM
ncbi:uncharacterized protein LOC124120820 isoform X1 [Haliotis rufescens]|uniref:uncharacterized protein LOC124120820 isoform X1 n=2 Tax=Haliotis rufescens TaxID=6454 RepID=UPI001EB072B6|nr:uncharacterized protein LOC124120820 isoform X1 [Haliotis rufescens]